MRETRGSQQRKAQKIALPCPTPEVLTGVQLKRVEVEKLDEQTSASLEDEISKNVDYPQPNSEECHKDGVRSNRQKPELASSPLREGISVSNVCTSQTQ